MKGNDLKMKEMTAKMKEKQSLPSPYKTIYIKELNSIKRQNEGVTANFRKTPGR